MRAIRRIEPGTSCTRSRNRLRKCIPAWNATLRNRLCIHFPPRAGAIFGQNLGRDTFPTAGRRVLFFATGPGYIYKAHYTISPCGYCMWRGPS